ncbi:unnamed protein product [Durusdinium trenchii]|uniref:Uncharacterized protein n=1 Tax=Durusdinium trenchii TaxID=1381693 RepID=A0ABP0J997_9DINO
MAIPVSGSVTLNGSQAVVALDVGAQNAPTTPGAPLQILLQKTTDGQMPIHESRLPVLKKHLAAMVCNVQRGLKLAPVGLLGAWSKEAESRLLTLLKKPKMVCALEDKKDTSPLAFPSTSATKDLALAAAACTTSSSSDSSSTSSSGSSSESSDAGDEPGPNQGIMAEADDTHEGTPNPALGPPQDDVETDFSDAAVVEPPAKCAKCERYLQLQYDFDSLADSHQPISDALEVAEEENKQLKAMAAFVDEAMKEYGGKEWQYDMQTAPCHTIKHTTDIEAPLTVADLLRCCRPPAGVKSTNLLLDVHLSIADCGTPENIASAVQNQRVDELPAALQFAEPLPEQTKLGCIVAADGHGQYIGHVYEGMFLDDPNRERISMADLKSFFTVEEEQTTSGRYNDSKLPRNCMREEFLKLTRRIFAGDRLADVLACLKRAVVIVLGQHAMYLRLPSQDSRATVHRIKVDDLHKDLLSEKDKPLYSKYKLGIMEHGPEWQDETAREVRMISAGMEKFAAGRPEAYIAAVNGESKNSS